MRKCLNCSDHPGWAHGDPTRRREPDDLCRACLGSGIAPLTRYLVVRTVEVYGVTVAAEDLKWSPERFRKASAQEIYDRLCDLGRDAALWDSGETEEVLSITTEEVEQ